MSSPAVKPRLKKDGESFSDVSIVHTRIGFKQCHSIEPEFEILDYSLAKPNNIFVENIYYDDNGKVLRHFIYNKDYTKQINIRKKEDVLLFLMERPDTILISRSTLKFLGIEGTTI